MSLGVMEENSIKEKILVLTDIPSIINSVKSYFQNYTVVGISEPSEAINLLKKEHFDLIVLDYIINSVHTDYVIAEIRTFDKDIYILLITEPKDLVSPLETIRLLDVQSYYEKSESFDQLALLIESGIKSINQMKLIREMNSELSKYNTMLEQSYLDSIEVLKNTVEAKDFYTKGHSNRVAEYSLLIGERLNLSDSEMRLLKIGSFFHDIGKIGIPDAILLKTDKLTKSEYEKIKEHPAIGAHILSNSSIFSDILPIVKYHHEYYNGAGYPYGLAGEEIPILARIVSVADAFDAITSKRSYRDASTIEEAKNEIKKCSGSQFDPMIAQIFIDILDNNFNEILEIHEKY